MPHHTKMCMEYCLRNSLSVELGRFMQITFLSEFLYSEYILIVKKSSCFVKSYSRVFCKFQICSSLFSMKSMLNPRFISIRSTAQVPWYLGAHLTGRQAHSFRVRFCPTQKRGLRPRASLHYCPVFSRKYDVFQLLFILCGNAQAEGFGLPTRWVRHRKSP